jgi:flagellar motor switch protein FliG
MGVFNRFKKNPEGLRQLVELWEGTPLVRRQKMIEVGMREDPKYTTLALQYMLVFDDVIKLSDLELTEVLSAAPPTLIGYAVYHSSTEVKERFLAKVAPSLGQQIKEVLDGPPIALSLVETGQMKVVEVIRKLEKANVIATKRIPLV